MHLQGPGGSWQAEEPPKRENDHFHQHTFSLAGLHSAPAVSLPENVLLLGKENYVSRYKTSWTFLPPFR